MQGVQYYTLPDNCKKEHCTDIKNVSTVNGQIQTYCKMTTTDSILSPTINFVKYK